ncbi:MAG: hemolysin III family protein [Rubricoccaceae bacterium]|nr:hemolysin III family protein [Rubricoccaceae bacterium]
MAVVLGKHEELLNTLTHGFGVLASLVGGASLITMSALYGDMWQILGSSVFSASLVLLYTASTLYHAVRNTGIKKRLRIFDHASIFILIAGTYTPFMLVGLRGGWGWSLFGVVWGLAIVGVILKLFLTGRFNKTSTGVYLAMGWLAIIAIGPLMEALPTNTLLWMAAGGIVYTAGTVFYLSRRIPYAHAIWHIFVLIGSACHFVAAYTHLVPGR